MDITSPPRHNLPREIAVEKCPVARYTDTALGIEAHYLLSDQQCELETIAQDPFLEEMAQLVEYLDREQQAVILEAACVVAVRNRGPALPPNA